jgi:hypothetical protein
VTISLRSQGRTFGAPGRPALADLVKDARDEHGERERAGQCRAVAAGDVGTPAVGGGAAWPASSRAIAHRRGPLPVAPMPRTPPQHTPHRNAPWVMRSASWPGRSSRARCANRQAKVTGTGPERRALSGSDGQGQARGQALLGARQDLGNLSGEKTGDPYYRRHCPTRHRHCVVRQAEPNRGSGYAHSMANAGV